MPVVDIDMRRLARLVGVSSRKKILDALPYLGLDIESADGASVRLEYSPNRPDYATDYGIAYALRGTLRVEPKETCIKIADGPYTMRTLPGVAKVRPFAVGIVARGGRLDEHAVGQLLAMQEDLHDGIGRRRRTASIGIHDLSRVKFPIDYTTAARDSRIVPLGETRDMSLGDVMSETDIGRKYADLIKSTLVPVMADAEGTVISFPPIINSAHTAISKATRDIFAEVTGTDARAVEDTLSVVAATLSFAGFSLYHVKTAKGSRSAKLDSKKMVLRVPLVEQTLGIKLSPSQIARCLRMSRIGATASGNRISCTIPRHRFDIIGEMDLVEEVALGYGIHNIEPQLPAQESSGRASTESAISSAASRCMVGLGYTEALNSGLVSASVLQGVGIDPKGAPGVLEPKSRVRTVLRGSLIPGLLDVLSRNVHEEYPQHIYEIGTIFSRAKPVGEHIALAGVLADKDASYTRAKSAAMAAILHTFGAHPKTLAASNDMLQDGHTADIVMGGRRVGVIGDVREDTLRTLRIREHVAAFEFRLDTVKHK